MSTDRNSRPERSDHLTKASIFISYALRHGPEKVGLTLDREGWTEVDPLLEACRRKGHAVDAALLAKIVAEDSKGRYSYNHDRTRIRANQGHSTAVDLGLKPLPPPLVLYHGTAERTLVAILKDGLKPMSRQHVHLSGDVATATTVGSRHGKVVVLVVDSAAAAKGGVSFYRSSNGIWLADSIPARFLRRLS